jgi:hypothetical protein
MFDTFDSTSFALGGLILQNFLLPSLVFLGFCRVCHGLYKCQTKAVRQVFLWALLISLVLALFWCAAAALRPNSGYLAWICLSTSVMVGFLVSSAIDGIDKV